MHLYVRILQEIEQQIGNGHYKQGHRLPSIQTFANKYACSKSTVIRALSELERLHLIYSVPKSGFYVVKKAVFPLEGKPNLIDFATTAPDPDLFPYLDFQHCINKAVDTYQNNLFAYGTGKGLPSLVQAVQKHLTNYQVFTQECQIFVISGVQQALSLLALMPFPNRKQKVLVEQPGYHLFIEFMETYQIPVIGIKRTEGDLFLDQLETLFRTEDIKFFYTNPRFQNPFGFSYSRKEKKRLIELSNKYDVYIVEDDYLADLENDNKSDPLFSYPKSCTIRILKKTLTSNMASLAWQLQLDSLSNSYVVSGPWIIKI